MSNQANPVTKLKTRKGTPGRVKEKNPVGPPTKYRDDMPQRALDWLETKKDTRPEGRLKVSLPTIEELAVEVLGISVETLYQWEKHKDKERLSEVIKKVREVQHRRLIESGLNGEYNSTIAKLILHKHGYSDKQEIDQNIKISGFGKMHEDLKKLEE